jgi:hypothetical protein
LMLMRGTAMRVHFMRFTNWWSCLQRVDHALLRNSGVESRTDSSISETQSPKKMAANENGVIRPRGSSGSDSKKRQLLLKPHQLEQIRTRLFPALHLMFEFVGFASSPNLSSSVSLTKTRSVGFYTVANHRSLRIDGHLLLT